jgi:hypothetical protein
MGRVATNVVGGQWVSTLWTRFFELWDLRNKVVHGVNINDYTTIQKAKLLDEIKDLHSRRDSFHRSDLPFLIAQNESETHKIEEFVDKNYVSTIRTWIRMWQPTFADGAKLAAEQAVVGTSRIYNHFPVLRRVVHNSDPTQRGRNRNRPHHPRKQRVDLSRFHRVTHFFSRAPAPPERSGTLIPTAHVEEHH